MIKPRTICLILSVLWCACSSHHGERALTDDAPLRISPTEARRTYCTRMTSPLCENLRGTQSIEVARALLEESCDEHQLDACHDLALLHQDPLTRQPLLTRACLAGYEPSCELAASYVLSTPTSSMEARARAFDMASVACDAGLTSSCRLLADHGAITPEQERSAYDRACASNDLMACHVLVMMDLDPERAATSRQEVASRHSLEGLCHQGVAESCAALARFATPSSPPWLLEPDYLRLTHWRQLACEHGDAESCMTLAHAYSRGTLQISRDDQMAARYFLAACQLGEVMACPHIPREEAMRHPNKWRGLYEEIARSAPPAQIFALGVYLMSQDQALEDYRWGLGQVMRSCEQDLFAACHVLWEGYSQGLHHMTPDASSAARLRKRICANKEQSYLECPEQALAVTSRKQDEEASCRPDQIDECVHLLDQDATKPVRRQHALATLFGACKQGNFPACGVLAEGFERGQHGMTPHAMMSRHVVQVACEVDPARCAPLADALLRGVEGLPVGLEQASSLWKKVCASEAMCIEDGKMYLEGKDDFAPRPAMGLVLLEADCIAGERAACEMLGEVHAHGKYGQPVDAEQAQSWRWRACRAESSVDACLQRAMTQIQSGKITQGLGMFQRACELGSKDACYMLSEWLSQEEDPYTLTVAYDASRRACALDVPRGCVTQARFLRSGRGGVTVDEAEATLIFERACRYRQEEACKELGQ